MKGTIIAMAYSMRRDKSILFIIHMVPRTTHRHTHTHIKCVLIDPEGASLKKTERYASSVVTLCDIYNVTPSSYDQQLQFAVLSPMIIKKQKRKKENKHTHTHTNSATLIDTIREAERP